MYQYILFDLDGTLTDSKPGIINCVQYALKHYGCEEPDREKLNRYVGPPLHKSFEVYAGFDPDKAMEAVSVYRERFATIGLFENSVYEGIVSMLQALKDAGRTLAVATSKPTVYTERILERYDLKKYFSVVVGSELDGSRTDKAEVIEETMRQLELTNDDRERVCMVGDREHDMIGAKKHNLFAIGALYGYSEGSELADAGADVLVENVKELQNFLMNH